MLLSKALSDAYINHDEFVSVDNVSREYNEMKEEIKNPENAVEYTIKKTMKIYCLTFKKSTANKTSSVGRTKQNRLMLLSNSTVCDKKSHGLLKIRK